MENKEISKRITVCLTPRLIETVKNLRKTDQYCLATQSEIIRHMLFEGAKSLRKTHNLT